MGKGKGSGFVRIRVKGSVGLRLGEKILLGLTGLLVLDMWEHAYYGDFRNDKEAYFNHWFSLIDWDEVGREL